MSTYENGDLSVNSDNSISQNCEARSNDPTNSNTNQATHGVIYSPCSEGGKYTCEQYNVKNSTKASEDAGVKRSTLKNNQNNNTFPAGKIIAVLAVAVALCVFLSSAAAFGITILTRRILEDYNSPIDENTSLPSDRFKPENNHVFVDRSEQPYLEQQVTQGELMTMENAIKAVKDSVVEITTETVNSGFGGYSQYVVSGAGSGVIISTSGFIVTNNHVIEGASNIIVRLTDGSEYKAELIGADSKTDIAVIAIYPEEGVELTSAVIGSSSALNLGQTVIAIGNPLGELGGTVTDGIISSLAREVAMEGSGTMTLLQTNAAVSPGNSGGGLFDLYGRLIGVVNAKSTGQGIEGISFAIPIDTAWDVAQQLIDKGYVSGRPALSINIKQVQYGLSFFGDIYYQIVVAEDYDELGLKENDIIVGIDNVSVSSVNDILNVVSSHKVGDRITLTIKRDKRQFEVMIDVIEYVPSHITE